MLCKLFVCAHKINKTTQKSRQVNRRREQLPGSQMVVRAKGDYRRKLSMDGAVRMPKGIMSQMTNSRCCGRKNPASNGLLHA